MFVICFGRKFGKCKETIHEHLSVHLRQLAKRVEVPLKQYTIFKISICMYFKIYIYYLIACLFKKIMRAHSSIHGVVRQQYHARNLLVFSLHLKTNILEKT